MKNIETKLKKLLTENGYDFSENDRSIITTCPQCSKAKHMYLFKETGNGKCMKCGTTYSPQAFVVAVAVCTFAEAYKILESGERVEAHKRLSFGTSTSKTAGTRPSLTPIVLPSNFFPLKRDFAIEGYEYMRDNRKLEDLDTLIEWYDLMYCPSMKRVIFPIRQDGVMAGWQGRDITGRSELRYLSPSGFQKAKVLLGYDMLNTGDPPADHIILTEGPIDMLKVAFLENAVCTMGKEISQTQLDLIRDLPNNEVVLALDPDAFMVFDKLAAEFKPEKNVTLMTPPEGKKDFGECSKREVAEAFKNRKIYTKGSMLSGAILK